MTTNSIFQCEGTTQKIQEKKYKRIELLHTAIMNTTNNQKEGINLEEFEKNLSQQKEFYQHYLDSIHQNEYYYSHLPYQNKVSFPFTDHSGFWTRYWEFRACVASLLQNPDTKDDEDFINLCDYWRNRSYPGVLSKGDFNWMKECYYSLLEKPSFKNNPYFDALFGLFVKSIYQLFTEPYYWQGFFDLD